MNIAIAFTFANVLRNLEVEKIVGEIMSKNVSVNIECVAIETRASNKIIFDAQLGPARRSS